MKSVFNFIVILLISFTTFGNASAANLVVNGSFEQPGGTRQVNPGDTSLTGWEVTGGVISVLEGNAIPGFSASDGTHYLNLTGNSNTAGNGIQQTMNLIAGNKYRFSMDLGSCDGMAGSCSGPIDVSASIGNIDGSFTHSTAGWDNYGFEFIANTTNTLLITGLSLPAGNVFIGLDNVLVELVDDSHGGEVPLPAGAWLFSSGLLALFGTRRMRRTA